MDVRCEKCSTTYDFDDAKIPVAGLSVKCSSCSHVFRVWRNAPVQTADEQWMLRQVSGNMIRFREMTTLQRWIVERKVTPNDDISKTGQTWRRLGDIPELAPFFVAVEQPPLPPTPLVPPPGVQWTSPGGPAPMAWQGTPQPPSPGWQAAAAQRSNEPGLGDNDPEDESDDLKALKGRSGGGLKWLGVLVVLAAAAGGVYALRPDLVQLIMGSKENPALLAKLAAGDQALLRDSLGGFNSAHALYEEALALDPQNLSAKAALGHCEVLHAESLRELAPAGPEGESQRTEATSRLERASVLLRDATAATPPMVRAHAGLAHYYRLANVVPSMKAELDRAKGAGTPDPWVSLAQGAAAMTDPTLSERAIRYLDEASEASPSMQRSRVLLAKVFLAQDNKAKAETLLNSIVSAEPSHELAQMMLKQLRPPEAVPAAPEPPPIAAAPTKELTLDQIVAQAERLRTNNQPGKALRLYERALEMEPDDPDIQTGAGNCYVDLEEPDAAIASFKKALELAPRFTDAHIGLGEAYRMKGMKRDAIKHYRAYLDILPEGPDAEVAKRMLDQLSQ